MMNLRQMIAETETQVPPIPLMTIAHGTMTSPKLATSTTMTTSTLLKCAAHAVVDATMLPT
jgi:hypothetical protein